MEKNDDNPFSFSTFLDTLPSDKSDNEDEIQVRRKKQLQIADDEIENSRSDTENSHHEYQFSPRSGDDEFDDELCSLSLPSHQIEISTLSCDDSDSESEDAFVLPSLNQDQSYIVDELHERIHLINKENESLKKICDRQKSVYKGKEAMLIRRIQELEKELSTVKRREREDTAALEDVVHMVENNLAKTAARATKFENLSVKLKEELRRTQEDSVSREMYNKLLKDNYDLSENIRNKARHSSNILMQAVNDAGPNLKHLMDGLKVLQQVSDELYDINAVSEPSPDLRR